MNALKLGADPAAALRTVDVTTLREPEHPNPTIALNKKSLENYAQVAANYLRAGDPWIAFELLIALGRPDDAVEAVRSRLSPGTPYSNLKVGNYAAVISDKRASAYEIAEASLLMGEPALKLSSVWRFPSLALTAIGQYRVGDIQGSASTLSVMISNVTNFYPLGAADVALVYASQGDVAAAVDWLEKATQNGDPGLFAHSVVQSPLIPEEVREHPDWRYQLRQMYAAPDQLAQFKFEVRT